MNACFWQHVSSKCETLGSGRSAGAMDEPFAAEPIAAGDVSAMSEQEELIHSFNSQLYAERLLADPAQQEELPDAGVYRIHSSALLLTYQCRIPFDRLRENETVAKAQYWSFCHELNSSGHVHTHAYLAFGCRLRAVAGAFAIDDFPETGEIARPRIDCCRARGKGHASAVQIGLVYCALEEKEGYVTSETHWPPGVSVPLSVLRKWWQDRKISHDGVVRAARRYRVSTAAFELTVRLHAEDDRKRARVASLEERRVQVRRDFRPFKEPGAFTLWAIECEQVRARYRPLVLVSPPGYGKTEFISAKFPRCFWHRSCLVWNGYDAAEHDAVAFDDLPDLSGFVRSNKILLQSNRCVWTGGSATNIHARELDVVGKPMVILCNEEPSSPWLQANACIIVLEQPLY